jgi:hypothetical protein
VVKVYVSVFGDERGKGLALAGLKAKAKYVRSELGRRMKLRLTPEIRFIEDESLERGSRVKNFDSIVFIWFWRQIIVSSCIFILIFSHDFKTYLSSHKIWLASSFTQFVIS